MESAAGTVAGQVPSSAPAEAAWARLTRLEFTSNPYRREHVAPVGTPNSVAVTPSVALVSRPRPSYPNRVERVSPVAVASR